MSFIKHEDFNGFIKPEILQQLIGQSTNSQPSEAFVRATDTAIATITEYLGGRFNCSLIFTPHTTGSDTRNKHIIKIVVVVALYYLYHQVGTKDLPNHRQTDYDDAISWLKDAGRGNIQTTLPYLENSEQKTDIFISSRKPFRHKF